MFKTILVPVDLKDTPLARKAMAIAVDQARQENTGLHLISVLPGFGMPIVASYFPTAAMREAKKEIRAKLKTYAERHVPEDVQVAVAVAEGNPYEQILKQAGKIGADLIVMPSYAKRGGDEVLLGSCASKVVRHAHCSVIVVRV